MSCLPDAPLPSLVFGLSLWLSLDRTFLGHGNLWEHTLLALDSNHRRMGAAGK